MAVIVVNTPAGARSRECVLKPPSVSKRARARVIGERPTYPAFCFPCFLFCLFVLTNATVQTISLRDAPRVKIPETRRDRETMQNGGFALDIFPLYAGRRLA